jgi:hypothetical protein
VLFHAIPSAPQALAQRAVTRVGGGRFVDRAALIDAVERASPALPISRSEAEGLAAFLSHRSGLVELSLLDEIKKGNFGI